MTMYHVRICARQNLRTEFAETVQLLNPGLLSFLSLNQTGPHGTIQKVDLTLVGTAPLQKHNWVSQRLL